MTEFQTKFYERWYGINDDKKQVLVFPELKDKIMKQKKIERLPGKGRTYSSLDETVERLEKGEQVNVIFSPSKIRQNSSLEDLTDSEKVQEYIASWAQRLNGLNLILACHIEYSVPKNENLSKKVKKITGWVSRNNVIMY